LRWWWWCPDRRDVDDAPVLAAVSAEVAVPRPSPGFVRDTPLGDNAMRLVMATADGRASSLTEALDPVVPESEGEHGYDCCS